MLSFGGFFVLRLRRQRFEGSEAEGQRVRVSEF